MIEVGYFSPRSARSASTLRPSEEAWNNAGGASTVAAVTTLIVQRLGGERVEQTTSVVPIVVAAGGLVMCFLAGRRSTPDGRHGS